MGNDGRFVWFDLMTTDVEAAQDFYRQAIGWGTQAWNGGESRTRCGRPASGRWAASVASR